ncbi:hypothetical protein [Flavobacterium notoginsengisoli]|uniref:hypothetical protein n=1 Tax=Flavobacterium notoginsengisoli TaxID=1478199 RepID=UPI00362BBA46
MAKITSEIKLVDTAAVITVGGIILYQMGWIYWTSYFSALSINSSFVEMSFEKLIATTWNISVLIIFSFSISAVHAYDSTGSRIDAHTAIATIILAVLCVFEKYFNNVIFPILLTGAVFLFCLYLFLAPKFKIPSRSFDKRIFIYFSLLIMYLVSFFVYSAKGRNDAEKLVKDSKNPDMEIFCNDGSRTRGRFISSMNGRYFILAKDEKGKMHTFIFSDSEVHHVIFTKEFLQVFSNSKKKFKRTS